MSSFDGMDNLYARAVRLNHVRSGQGDPVVLLHGIGDSLRAWDPVRERLAAHHEVIAVDLPGFGRSRALRDGEPTPAALARAVIDFMDGARFHAVGNSLGGGIAFELARAGHARSVTALSPIGFVRGWERPWARAMLQLTHIAGPRLGLRLGPKAASWLMMERPRPREVLAAGLEDLRHAPGWDATLPRTLDYAFAGDLDVPVTIAWAEHDRVLLRRQAVRARAALPEAEHLTLHGCGHVSTWDDPDRVARAVIATCRRAGVAASPMSTVP